MKRITYLVSFFVLVIYLVSCEEVVNLKDTGVKPKLVLYCFLSPQYDTISVYLSNSQPLFSSDKILAEVRDAAVVEISNDNKNWTQIPYSKDNKRYWLLQSQFPIIEGKTYYIRASVPNYESISASCTIPFWRETNPKPELDSVPNTNPSTWVGSNFNTLLYFSWKDYPNEKNYYALMYYEFHKNIDWRSEEGKGIMTNYFTYHYIKTEDLTGEMIYSDEEKDGQKINLLWKTIEYITPFMFNDTLSYGYGYDYYDSIYFLFIQTDETIFLYENSIALVLKTGGFASMFTVEPNLIYSNIKNGYGVFGAMTFKSYRVNFRKQTIEEAEHQKK